MARKAVVAIGAGVLSAVASGALLFRFFEALCGITTSPINPCSLVDLLAFSIALGIGVGFLAAALLR